MQSLIPLTLHYRYLVLYAVTILEGSVSTIAAGFLVSLGILNPIVTLGVVVVGDMSSDLFFYCLGRLGSVWRGAHRFARYFNLESNRERFIRLFERHGGKMIIFSKLTHYLAGIIFTGAGYSRINPWRIIWYSFIGAFIKALILAGGGYLAGVSYLRFYKYFEYGSLVLAVTTVILVVVFYYFSDRLLDINKAGDGME